MSRIVSLIVLIAIILVISALFYKVMSAFLVPLFLAAILVVLFRPLHRWMLGRCSRRDRAAAGLTTATIVLIVLLPLAWIFSFAVVEGVRLISGSDVSTVEQKIMERVDNIRSNFDLELPENTNIRVLESNLFELLPKGDPSAHWPSPHQALKIRQRLETTLDAIQTNLDAQIAEPDKTDEVRQELDFVKASAGRLRGSIIRLVNLLPNETSEIHDQKFETVPDQNISAAILNGNVEPDRGENGQLRALVEETQLNYEAFRSDLVSAECGSVKGWLVNMLNPTGRQIDSLTDQGIRWIRSSLLSISRPTAALGGRLLLGLAIMTISIYYFLLDGPKMISTMMRLSPLDDRHETELVCEFDKLSRAVVMAALLSAVVQGILAGVGFFFAGVDSIFLLTALTMVFALVPFVGAAAVWVPVALWLGLIEDRTLAAVLIALYGVLIISMADNLIKPLVLHGQSNLHPLFALLSVLGGVQALGPIGILVGPMIVALLQALLNMLQKEILSIEKAENVSASS